MKTITNPQYDCILANCPSCLEVVSEKKDVLLYLWLVCVALFLGFIGYKVYQEKRKPKTIKPAIPC